MRKSALNELEHEFEQILNDKITELNTITEMLSEEEEKNQKLEDQCTHLEEQIQKLSDEINRNEEEL